MIDQALDQFEQILRCAKNSRRLSTLLDPIRTLDEADEDTLRRLIRERSQMVRLLQKFGLDLPETCRSYVDLLFARFD